MNRVPGKPHFAMLSPGVFHYTNARGTLTVQYLANDDQPFPPKFTACPCMVCVEVRDWYRRHPVPSSFKLPWSHPIDLARSKGAR